MQTNREIKLFLFACCITACLPAITMAQDAGYNFAHGVNFAPYKTYAWVNIEGAGADDQALDSEIKQAVEAQLATKGLTKSNQEAQLYVAYQVSFRREKQIAQYIGGYAGYGPGWGYGCTYGSSYGGCSAGFTYGGAALSTMTGATIQLGNLVLDIYDATYRDLVWRGNVSKALSIDQKKQTLDKALAKLLKNYPLQPKKLL